MGAGDLLRRVDEIILPPVTRLVRFLLKGSGRRRLLATVGLLGGAALIVTAVWQTDEPARPVDDSGAVVRIGVNEGDSIPDYLEGADEELSTLAGTSAAPVWALVALDEYVSPATLTSMMDGYAAVRVYARVPLPRTQTEIVPMNVVELPADLESEMDLAAVRKAEEATGYGDLAAKLTGDSEQELEQREVYLNAQEMATAEADAYAAHCACAYAVVLRAAPADLLELAERDGVRTVDPAPEVTKFEHTVFLPVLPEQHEVAGPADSSLSDREPPVESQPASERPR